MKLKRIVSMVLVVCMLATVCPVVFAQDTDSSESTVWETVRLSELSTEEMGEGVIYAGTKGGDADERGLYSFTIFRDGYCDEEATVELHSVDISASYGVDYQIIGEDTVYKDLGGTVMERNANYDAGETLNQFADEVNALEEMNETLATDNDEVCGNDESKSSLAKIKEEQTGIESRDTSSDEQTNDLAESVVKMMTPKQEETAALLNEHTSQNLGEYIESSSTTLITFEPGENEKQITIEVFEDDEAEADEIAYFFLSGASGALIGDMNSVTMKIVDDEKDEDIFVGFSDSAYHFSEGENNVTIIRTGAVYEMVSVDVRLDDDTQTVFFKAYETEKDVAITVSGSGEDELTLENFMGCQEGDITKATVNFGESEKVSYNELPNLNSISDAEVSMANTTRGDKTSFELNTISGHNGYPLRVDYVPGQTDKYGHLYGKIMDTGRNPEVYVGNYYFPSSFSYNVYTGYGSPSERESKHGYNGSNPTNEPGGYAYLHWYDWRTWKNGTAYTVLHDVDHSLYQYYAVDWHQSRDAYGGQNSRFKVFPNGGYRTTEEETTNYKSGLFSRCLTTQTALGKNNLPQGSGGYLEAHAEDSNDNRTPKVTLYVYGFAAFFRQFDISINQPAKMEFVDSGNVKTNKTPVNVSLGDGHSLRYTEQSLAIKQNSAYQSGIIPGELIGYKIETNPNSSKDKKTFYYMAYGKTPSMAVGSYSGTYYNAEKGANMESIYFGEDFIKNKIDKNLAAVSGSGTGWSTSLRFTPLYSYKDATVQIVSNANGSFKNFDTKTYYNYHVGDTLSFEGEPKDETYVFAGYKVTGRATSNLNDTPLIDQTVWTENESQLNLLLGEKNCTFYQIEPVFKKRQGNYITISDVSKGHVKISNLLSKNDIKTLKAAYPDYGFDEDQNIYVVNSQATGNTDAERILNSITVKAGEIYRIYADGADETTENGVFYKPTFKNDYFSSYTIKSRVLDYIASADLSENIITVGAEQRVPSDENYVEINGSIMSAEYTIRQSAATTENVGVENLSVSAGDRGFSEMWATVDNKTQKISQPERASCTTDENGNFKLSGVLAKDTDAFTMYYTCGDIEGVRIINLSKLSQKEVCTNGEISYFTAVANDDKTNSEKEVKVNGKIYDLNKSENSYYNNITTPIFTQDSPYPTSIDYTYLSGDNIEQFGTTSNSVAIVDDVLTLSLTVNRNGHQISKVDFIIDRQQGADETYTVEGKINQDVFTCNFDGKEMDKIFEAGDRIYVILYDADQREISYPSTDGNGNEITVTQKEDIVYNKVFTGLSLFVPMLEVMPQNFTLSSSATQEAPILGQLQGSATTGTVAFSVKEWDAANGIQGISLVLDANINLWNKNGQTTPAQDLLEKVEQMKTESMDKAIEEFANNDLKDGETFTYGELMNNETTKKYYDSIYKKALAENFSKVKMNLNFIVLLNFNFAYSASEGAYMLTDGQIVFGGSYAVSRVFYWCVYGVPLYLQLSGDFALQLQMNFNAYDSMEYDVFKEYENLADIIDTPNDGGLFLKLAGKISVGVGICGVVGARGVVKAEVRTYMSVIDIENNSGIVGAIRGGFGIDLCLFSFEYTVGYQLGCGIYENASGWLTDDNDGVTLKQIRTHSVGDTKQVGSEVQKENGYEVLISDAPERTKPQVLCLNDGRKLLVYIGTSHDRELDINKHCLYYSVYDGTQWSEAQVVENDGTADATPSVAVYGDKVIVAWADATREFTKSEVENGHYKDILADFDISASIFDPSTSTFGDVMKISNDSENYNERFLDYAPIISADKNGEHGAVILYVKRDVLKAENDNEIISENAVYETIALSVINKDKEVLKEQYMAVEGDPLMFNLDSALDVFEINGEKHVFSICTYAADKDNDLTSNTDWDVYLLLHDITANKTYQPINLCNDFVADATPRLTRIGDSVYLTYLTYKENTSDSGIRSVLNYMSVTDMFDLMQHGITYEDGTREYSVDMADVLADDNLSDNILWYQKMAQELGLSDDVYSNSIFAELYKNNFPINQIDMSIDENSSASIGSYELSQGKDGKLYLLWIDAGSTDEDDYSIELYGAVNNVNAEDGERSGWSKPVRLTDFSETIENSVIDEFSVAVDENGEFTLVSNMYCQNLNGSDMEYTKNKLIAFTLDESGDMMFNDSISFDTKYPKLGEEAEISFSVKNDGLQALDLSHAVIKVDGCDEKTVDINQTLFGGESTDIKSFVDMPKEISDSTKVTVTVYTVDGESISLSDSVPCGASISFDTQDVVLNDDGTYSYIVEVTNNGNKASGKFELNMQRIESGSGLVGDVSSISAKSLEPGESKTYTVKLSKNTLKPDDFSEYNLAKFSVKAMQGDDEISGSIKRISSSSVKSASAVVDDNSSNNKPSGGSASGGYSTESAATPTPSATPSESEAQENTMPFTDVKTDDWFYDSVKYAYENGMFTGTTETTFEPESPITRGMFVTVLGREAGIDNSDVSDMPFSDVNTDEYYAPYVKWAAENKIINGYGDGTFGPDDLITREQMAAIIYRYAEFKGDAPQGAWAIKLDYADVSDISDYAVEGVMYCTMKGIMNGKEDNRFAPKDNALRAEIAAVMMRYSDL